MSSTETVEISKRFKLIRPTNKKSWPWQVKPNRVLVLFLPWLHAQERHVNKYVDVYSNLGLDVLCMKSHIMDFLWPPTSLKAGSSLIGILQNQCKDYDRIFIHSMSIGAYTLTNLHMLLIEDESGSCKPLLDKICAVVYDSAVMGYGKTGIILERTDPERGGPGVTKKTSPSVEALDFMIRGMATSVSKSKIVFYVIYHVAKLYFALTKSITVNFYVKAYDMVRDEPFEVPTLLLASKNDPMCDYRVVTQLADIWRGEHAVPVWIKVWDKSGHAQHLACHREEYLGVHGRFLSEILVGKSSYAVID